MQISTTTNESNIEIPQKTGNRIALRSSDITPGIYPKEYNTGHSRDTCILMFIIAIFIITKL
jgi:hypothetical protein